MKYSELKTEELADLSILQGEENDYGEYDYLITDLPESYVNKKVRDCMCDNCGKYKRVVYENRSYFYTIDGYDYMSWRECPKCAGKTLGAMIKRKIKHIKRWYKARIECYNLAKSCKNLNAGEKWQLYCNLMYGKTGMKRYYKESQL